MIKYFALFLTITLSTTGLSDTKVASKIEFKRNDEVIAQYVSYLVSHYHYSKKPLDNQLSELFLDELFYTLDNQRRYFLQSDIDEFSRYRYVLDDMLEKGNLSFAGVVFKRYLKRLEERVAYLKGRVEMPFDYSIDEKVIIDRKESPWAKSSQELDDIWRRSLKNEFLVMEYDVEKEKSASEDESKSQKEKKMEKMLRSSLPPKERLLKRYTNFYKHQKEKTTIEVLELVLGAMARCYDPHSNYLGPQTEEEFNISMNLEFSGIGAQLMTQDGYTLVTRIIPGGPASKDKRLEAGDKIFAVAQGDGSEVEDILDMNLKKVVNRIRGKKGSVVHLHIIKETGERRIVDIVRGKVELKDSEARGELKIVKDEKGVETKVGVIQLPSFYMDFQALQRGDKNGKSSTRDVSDLIKKLKKEGMQSLILDLRNNGGGSLLESVRLSGLFIDRGPIVQIKTADGDIQVRDDHPAGTLYDGPLVVMTNHNSASAAEITAAAIQDYGRGIIVGSSKTHGKGTVQTVRELKQLPFFRSQKSFKPGEVKYTIAKFYRVNGGSTQKKGVEPDIVFPDYGDFEKYSEKDLRHCMEWDEVPAQEVTSNTKVRDLLPKLRQLSEKRRSRNESFKVLIQDLEEYRKIVEREEVSLKKAVRFKELKEIEEKSKKRRELYDQFSGNNDEEEEEGEEDPHKVYDDFYLLETLKISSDLLSLYKR